MNITMAHTISIIMFGIVIVMLIVRTYIVRLEMEEAFDVTEQALEAVIVRMSEMEAAKDEQRRVFEQRLTKLEGFVRFHVEHSETHWPGLE